MSSVESRLTALADAFQRRQMEQSAPVDELSRSLFDLQRELAALDEVGKAKLLAALNNPDDAESNGLALTTQDVEWMIDDWRPR